MAALVQVLYTFSLGKQKEAFLGFILKRAVSQDDSSSYRTLLNREIKITILMS